MDILYIKIGETSPNPLQQPKKKETHLEKDYEKNGWIFAAKLLETLHELL